MTSTYFVNQDCIVRKIWGKSDTILFVFAGAAAEFALNKAVDWLYFTGKLPKDPLGRLFSTVTYAKHIVFAEKDKAHNAIDAITNIHKAIETKRNDKIPDWAYRDVLFMLIDYSIRAFEVLERPLTLDEKQDVFHVFNRVGKRMGLKQLPKTFNEWNDMRNAHLHQDLEHSHFTKDLFRQYRKHLGSVRYFLLLETQKLLLPDHVKNLLSLKGKSLLQPLVYLYKISRYLNLDWIIREVLLPSNYKSDIKKLDILT